MSLFDQDDEIFDLNNLFGDDNDSWQTRSYYGDGSSSNRLHYSLEPRPTSNFVGLMNQGATCYLNSLLQALYMMPEFRSGIYSLVPDIIESKDDVLREPEIDPAEKLNLLNMGFAEDVVITALTLFPKPEQVTERFDWIFSANNEVQPKKKKVVVKRKLQKIPAEIQKLFAFLQKADQCAISTEDLTKSFGWESMITREQHDVHELNKVLFDAIERSLIRTSGKNLLQSLYNGIQVTKIVCLTCGYTSERSETFQDITVPVYHHHSLEEALLSITIPEVLSGTNQYNCDSCQRKVDAHRIVAFRSLPQVLNICLSRFEYNLQNGSRVKNSRRLLFPMYLDMLPFSEHAPREDIDMVTKLIYQIKQEEAKHNTPAKNNNTTANNTAATNNKPGANKTAASNNTPDVNDAAATNNTPGANNTSAPNTSSASDTGATNTPSTNIGTTNTSATKTSEGKDKDNEKERELPHLHIGNINAASPYLYELCNVIIHVGTNAGHGHYHSYIRDLSGEGQFKLEESDFIHNDGFEKYGNWYDFNDSIVTPIPTFKIANQYGGHSECGYMLVYRRRTESSPPPILPPHLIKVVEAQNESIEQERLKVKEQQYKIEVTAYSEERFKIDFDGRLLETISPNSSTLGEEPTATEIEEYENLDLFAEVPAHIPAPAVVESNNSGKGVFKVIKLDLRDKLSDFFEALKNNLTQVPDISKIHLHRIFDDTGKVHILKPIFVPSAGDADNTHSLSLSDIGITSKIKILVWDGTTINGQAFSPLNFKLTIPVSYKQPDGIKKEFTLYLSEDVTLQELKKCIELETSIPAAEQNISIQNKQKTASLRHQYEDINLFDLRIEGCSLRIDKINPQDPNQTSSYNNDNSEITYEEESKFLTLNILDFTQSSERTSADDKIIPIEVDKNSTIYDLKVLVMSKLSTNYEFSNLVFRRWNDGTPGSLYTTEKLTLNNVMKSGEYLIIERLDNPTEIPFPINFNITITDKPSSLSIYANESWSIEKLKSEMCKLIQYDPSNCRLYYPYFKTRKLLNDEKLLIKNTKLTRGTNIWVEEGPAPLPFEIQLGFDLYSFEDDDSKCPPKAIGLYSPLLHLSSWNKSLELHNYKLTPLPFKLEVSALDSLASLRAILYSKDPIFSSLPSPQHFRIWFKDRILKQENQNLNQMYLAQDSHLTIQILEQPDNYFNSTGDLGILLYVHLRKPGGGFEKVKEFMFYGGNQLKKLPEVLSEAFNIPIKHLLIARFEMYKGYWEIIFRDTEKENIIPNENTSTTNTPNNAKTHSDKPPLGEITSHESNTIQPTQQQQQCDTQTPTQPIHPNPPSQTVHPNSDKPSQATSDSNQSAEQPNSDNKQSTQTNPPQGKRRRQGKRKRPFMVDGCMIAIKDLRTDPNEEDNFAIEAAAFKSSVHSIYEPRSRGYTEGKQSHNRVREQGLKINVSDEEYSYEEVSYSEEDE